MKKPELHKLSTAYTDDMPFLSRRDLLKVKSLLQKDISKEVRRQAFQRTTCRSPAAEAPAATTAAAAPATLATANPRIVLQVQSKGLSNDRRLVGSREGGARCPTVHSCVPSCRARKGQTGRTSGTGPRRYDKSDKNWTRRTREDRLDKGQTGQIRGSVFITVREVVRFLSVDGPGRRLATPYNTE